MCPARLLAVWGTTSPIFNLNLHLLEFGVPQSSLCHWGRLKIWEPVMSQFLEELQATSAWICSLHPWVSETFRSRKKNKTSYMSLLFPEKYNHKKKRNRMSIYSLKICRRTVSLLGTYATAVCACASGKQTLKLNWTCCRGGEERMWPDETCNQTTTDGSQMC